MGQQGLSTLGRPFLCSGMCLIPALASCCPPSRQENPSQRPFQDGVSCGLSLSLSVRTSKLGWTQVQGRQASLLGHWALLFPTCPCPYRWDWGHVHLGPLRPSVLPSHKKLRPVSGEGEGFQNLQLLQNAAWLDICRDKGMLRSQGRTYPQSILGLLHSELLW